MKYVECVCHMCQSKILWLLEAILTMSYTSHLYFSQMTLASDNILYLCILSFRISSASWRSRMQGIFLFDCSFSSQGLGLADSLYQARDRDGKYPAAADQSYIIKNHLTPENTLQ